VALKFGALYSGQLRPHGVQRENASEDQYRYRHDSSRLHPNLPLLFKSAQVNLCDNSYIKARNE
jgi:hypothetical protein